MSRRRSAASPNEVAASQEEPLKMLKMAKYESVNGFIDSGR